ncbi:response regulator [Nitrospirales bacterium NOB]|nr:response regulator [Nitrospirales bacterium NOB]
MSGSARALGLPGAFANSGEHALVVLSTHDIHAMVLDLHLPGLQGAEVLRLTRKPGLGLPILLISAHLTPDRLTNC